MLITYITHPDVVIDPDVPVPQWPLSDRGRARMQAMLHLPWVKDVSALYCSSEQKALDGTAILGAHLGLVPNIRKDLGENDRSSTGYLPKAAFLAHVTRFFAEPGKSVGGWEPAQVAQDRIVAAIKEIARVEDSQARIAVIAHGGVGALLLTSLMARPISMDQEQPGQTGGNFFTFECERWVPVSGWRPVDP